MEKMLILADVEKLGAVVFPFPMNIEFVFVDCTKFTDAVPPPINTAFAERLVRPVPPFAITKGILSTEEEVKVMLNTSLKNLFWRKSEGLRQYLLRYHSPWIRLLGLYWVGRVQ